MKPAILWIAVTISHLVFADHSAAQQAEPNWQAAADYLDQRQQTWFDWPRAKLDHGTSCIACHTGVPFAMVRPLLRGHVVESSLSPSETLLLDNVRKRVNSWDNATLYYESDESKKRQSRGTESIINALILAQYEVNREELTDVGKAAMKILWDEQISAGQQRGTWHWLQFGSATDYEPWESNAADVYGASLAAIAVGVAPGNYRDADSISSNVQSLRERLGQVFNDDSVHNQLYIFWADKSLGGILSSEQQQELIKKVREMQNADGGWSTASLGRYQRTDGTDLDLRSDGYATGLITKILRLANVSREDDTAQRALQWLVENQDAEHGFWAGNSVHRQRDPESHLGQFTRDAATSFALLGYLAYHDN